MTIAHDQQADLDAISDVELLGRYVASSDESAFEQIVFRHGPMVLGVCRRVLGESHDAEDAFQATFLVLAQSGHKIRRRSSLASWLYGVAHRVSLKAARKRNLMDPLEEASVEDSTFEEVSRRSDEQLVGEELYALPDSYRGVMILSYLEERTNQQIADQMKLSVAAVEGRLKRGRAELRRRLLRRGVSLAGFAAILVHSQAATAALDTTTLFENTVEASLAYAATAARATWPLQN